MVVGCVDIPVCLVSLKYGVCGWMLGGGGTKYITVVSGKVCVCERAAVALITVTRVLGVRKR